MKLLMYQIFLLGLFMFTPKHAMAIKVNISGELLASPCILAIESGDQTVRFNAISTKDLYSSGVAATKDFSFILKNCDLSISKSVNIIFTGNKSAEQNGLLALDPGSIASGVAIGLKYKNNILPLGSSTGGIDLTTGENTLQFSAFVHGDPSTIENKTIKAGRFSAVANFKLNYP
ncbi:fimbrial protein [Iodobacter sp. CM08]|uniref:fimbrial protein n=1 Tax=Iodobacter sp. CM08 TaxID=3085902 RepID=UPI002981EE9F|nr:fimbrial protein [Iodobacter sp. CM08]MDW5415852.1 fimbrial protein [Iodobacter sp. CM08]